MQESFAMPAVLRRTAENIIRAMGRPPSEKVLLIYSQEKAVLVEQVRALLEEQGLAYCTFVLDGLAQRGFDELRHLLPEVAGQWGTLLLLQPQHAGFLFEVAGRPDQGVKISQQFFFCDWLADLPGLVRTYDVDWAELTSLRANLCDRLAGVKELRVTTAAGTDLVLYAREWHSSHGEVYTAPLEGLAQGTVLVDGCAYSGPPSLPFLLRVEQGRVSNLNDLLPSDPQQKWVLADLSRDENACVLAELGIGINPGALANGSLMEAEQAQGTCHFGFGHNLPYGGTNASSSHLDLVVQSPTILADGCLLVDAGCFVMEKLGYNAREIQG